MVGTEVVKGWKSGERRAALALLSVALGGAGLLGPSVAGVVHADGTCTTSGSQVTCTFASTGAEQTFVVPAGVSTVQATAIGAAGGANNAGTAGGRGAQVSGTLSGLASGQTLYVEVGGAPTNDAQNCYGTTPCNGGWNGGGSSNYAGGGGAGPRTCGPAPGVQPTASARA